MPISVRYIVNDVDAAVGFYTDLLGFTVEMRPAPQFAMLSRGDLRLLLSQPGTGGGGASLGGVPPTPGGWNRFQLEEPDLASAVERLKARGATLRGDIITGVGGKQALVEDPSGNPIELFQA